MLIKTISILYFITDGLLYNAYTKVIQNEVCLNDLFY